MMSNIEQIERQIEQLSRDEFEELRDWILDRTWDAWDSQIGEDAQTGKLDSLVKESEEDYRSGRSREL